MSDTARFDSALFIHVALRGIYWADQIDSVSHLVLSGQDLSTIA